MNKELIKKIENLKGVETVELTKKGFKGTFEPQEIAVKCDTQEQFTFALKQEGREYVTPFNLTATTLVGIGRVSDHPNDTIIPFTKYLTDYNLTYEWKKYLIGEAERRGYKDGVIVNSFIHNKEMEIKNSRNDTEWIGDYDKLHFGSIDCLYVVIYLDGKWAEIIPYKKEVVLVRGEIYYIHYETTDSRTLRYKGMDGERCVFFYTQYSKEFGYMTGSSNPEYEGSLALHGNKITEATDKKKRKLIKQEVKNGYFHELNK